MVIEVTLLKLRTEVTPDRVDEMMRRVRSILLRVPQVLTVRSGKKIEPFCEWPFFIAVEFETRDKQAMAHDDPLWLKYTHEVLKPHATEQLTLHYELEPGRDVKYS